MGRSQPGSEDAFGGCTLVSLRWYKDWQQAWVFLNIRKRSLLLSSHHQVFTLRGLQGSVALSDRLSPVLMYVALSPVQCFIIHVEVGSDQLPSRLVCMTPAGHTLAYSITSAQHGRKELL